jgi:hypothetical protein
MTWALQAGCLCFNPATARTYALLSIKKLGLLGVRNVPCGKQRARTYRRLGRSFDPSWLANRHPSPLAWL